MTDEELENEIFWGENDDCLSLKHDNKKHEDHWLNQDSTKIDDNQNQQKLQQCALLKAKRVE